MENIDDTARIAGNFSKTNFFSRDTNMLPETYQILNVFRTPASTIGVALVGS